MKNQEEKTKLCQGEQQEHEDAHEHPHWGEREVWRMWSMAEVCGRPHENCPQDWEAKTLHRGEHFFSDKNFDRYFERNFLPIVFLVNRFNLTYGF